MLKRFIRYLYEYEQGKRTRNVGFVKVEQEERESTVHIHGKGLRLSGGDTLSVSLFFEEKGQLWSVVQGEIAYMGPSVNYQLKYTDEDVGLPGNYSVIKGILLKNEGGRRFTAVWEDAPFDIDSIRPWREGQNAVEIPDDKSGREEALPDAPAGGTVLEETAPVIPVQEEASVEEYPEREGTEETQKAELEMQAEEKEQRRWKASKIQRREISTLPRCEWRLANNNFLLHGYGNYRHLALLDDGKVLRLGVPGIYHEKEARAAAGFGFPEFINVEETSISLVDEERNLEEQFGYWCRQVRRSAR